MKANRNRSGSAAMLLNAGLCVADERFKVGGALDAYVLLRKGMS